MPDVDAAAGERLELARRKLQDARRALDVELFPAAVHEAYYGAFHAAQGLLATEGVEARTHRGTIQEVGRLFVRTDRLDEEMASLLARLLDLRLEGDYGVMEPPERDDAVWAVDAATRYVDAVARLLESASR